MYIMSMCMCMHVVRSAAHGPAPHRVRVAVANVMAVCEGARGGLAAMLGVASLLSPPAATGGSLVALGTLLSGFGV